MIEESNNLDSEDVTVGSKLIIPIAPGKADDTVAYSKKATRYKVRKGDTLGSIADDFQVPVEKVRKWNHLKSNTVATGRTLLIYKALAGSPGPESASSGDDPSAPSKSGKKSKTTTVAKSGSKSGAGSQAATVHKVKKGETLSSIAQSYNTTVANLKKNNANLSANLRAGEVLVISQVVKTQHSGEFRHRSFVSRTSLVADVLIQQGASRYLVCRASHRVRFLPCYNRAPVDTA